eukprot:scaffold9364_cov216-Amphora_coffeaeformis.AAC.4
MKTFLCYKTKKRMGGTRVLLRKSENSSSLSFGLPRVSETKTVIAVHRRVSGREMLTNRQTYRVGTSESRVMWVWQVVLGRKGEETMACGWTKRAS